MASSLKSPGTAANDSSVGAIQWNSVNNVKIEDINNADVYINPNVITNYLKATNFGFSIPDGATINGIYVEIKKRASYAEASKNVKDKYIKIVKSNGSIGTTDNANTVSLWPTTMAYSGYGGSSDKWGETWSSSDINDSDFGVVVSAVGTASRLDFVIGYVDHIRITVDYTEAPSSQIGTIDGLARASVATVDGLALASLKSYNGLE